MISDHIRCGSGEDERVAPLKALAEWSDKRRRDEDVFDRPQLDVPLKYGDSIDVEILDRLPPQGSPIDECGADDLRTAKLSHRVIRRILFLIYHIDPPFNGYYPDNLQNYTYRRKTAHPREALYLLQIFDDPILAD